MSTDSNHHSDEMPRVTFRCPQGQVDDPDELAGWPNGEYPSRSEAIRAAIRELLEDHQ